MITIINQLLTAEKAKHNTLILQNDLSHGYIEPPLLGFANIAPYVKNTIEQAEREVLYIGYKLEGGSNGETDLIASLNILSDKAKRSGKKITVKFIVDHIQGPAGKLFAPPLPSLRKKDFPYLDFQYAEHKHYGLGSYHQKQFIVDGKVAILMSGEFSRANNYKNNYKGWVEIATIIRGEAVKHIRDGFIRAWDSKQTHTVNGKSKRPLCPTIPIDEPTATSDSQKAQILYLYKKANGCLFKRKYLSPHTIAVKAAIDNARDPINIMMPNINEPCILEALAKAYKRGVKINILTGKSHNDSGEELPLMGGTNRYALQKLIDFMGKEGIEDYSNIDIRFHTDENGKIVHHHGQQTLHAKLVIIGDLVFAGSSVLDKQSVFHSQEGDVCIESSDVAKSYREQIFDPVFARGKNAFLHANRKIKTPYQDILYHIEDFLQQAIAAFETKENSTKKNGTRRKLIQEVLGDKNNPKKFTLYHLQNEIKSYQQKANCLTRKDVHAALVELSSITHENILHNKKLNKLEHQQSLLHKMRRMISDGIKKLFSLHKFNAHLTTIGLFHNIGEASSKELSFFKTKNNLSADAQDSFTDYHCSRHSLP